MPLSGITTNVQAGGIGRRALNNDKISGILWFSATYPTGFSANAKNKKVFSLAEAEALGITSALPAFSVLRYHIKEYFRLNPQGELWIGIYPVPGGAYDWSEMSALFLAAQGEIRLLAIYANLLTFVASQCTAIQAVVDTNAALGFRASILYAPNFIAATDFTAATDLRTLNCPSVTVVTGQDGGGEGAALFVSKAFTISCVGALLGALSKAGVEESIGNPQNYNLSNGTELEVLAMSSGVLLSTISNSLLGNLKDKGYAVVRKYTPRLAGSYSERLPTATAITNDYAFLELRRTIDKAIRGVESALLPTIQSGIRLKSDGTMRDETIGFYQDLAGSALIAMMAAGELSGDAADVTKMVIIDPRQNILATSTLIITIKVIPVGITEFITVNIGLTTSL